MKWARGLAFGLVLAVSAMSLTGCNAANKIADKIGIGRSITDLISKVRGVLQGNNAPTPATPTPANPTPAPTPATPAPTTPATPAPTPAPDTPMTTAPTTPVPSKTAAPGQWSYFIFASPSDKTGRPEGIRPDEINAAIAKQCGGDPKRLLVGIDIGGLAPGDLSCLQAGKFQGIKNPGLRLAAEKGCGLHAYVEGPGGVTGSDWDEDEKQRTIERAKAVGITIKDPANENDPGTKAWNSWGWRKFTRTQLQGLKQAGFQTAEIDNIMNDPKVGDDESGAGIVGFYKEYAQWWQAGEVPRLTPKNLSVEQWQAIVAAINAGTLPRGMFADFSIAEEDVDDRAEGAKISAKLGIAGLYSNDTGNYATAGAIGAGTVNEMSRPAGAGSNEKILDTDAE